MARGWTRTNNYGIKSPIKNCCANLIRDSDLRALSVELPSPYWQIIANLPSAMATQLTSPQFSGIWRSDITAQNKGGAIRTRKPLGDGIKTRYVYPISSHPYNLLLPDVYDPTNAISFTLSTYTARHPSGKGRFRWRISSPLSA